MGEHKSTGIQSIDSGRIHGRPDHEQRGCVLLRQIDHKLGLCESMASQMYDPRRPDRIRYQIVELLREGLCESVRRALLASGDDHRVQRGTVDSGAIMDSLTDENLKFIGRLKGNSRLDELAAPHVYRPSGRPPSGGYEYTVELGMYQVEGWKHPQRLILGVEGAVPSHAQKPIPPSLRPAAPTHATKN